MHFDTRLVLFFVFIINLLSLFGQYSDDQSYLSLIEFIRGGSTTNLIFSSPHGGFLGGNLTTQQKEKSSNNPTLEQLPVAGCYNDTLEQCIYTIKDCLKANGSKISHRTDARCVLDRSSTLSMYLLTKAIAESFAPHSRPYTILNKLTRQYVDPAEDLLHGTFLIESSTRAYIDYHRFIAMSKEAIRSPSRGLFIEFIFHKNSQTIQLGYGYDPLRSSINTKPTQSTITELLSRSGPSVILGNYSFAYFLRLNGFKYVIPFEQSQQQQQQKSVLYRLSSCSTQMHADQRFNAILFSYPIERLRIHSLKQEAIRIAKSIEQFIQTNNIKSRPSSSSSSTNIYKFNYSIFCIFIINYIYIVSDKYK